MLVAIEKSHMMKLPNKSKETYKFILSNLKTLDHHSLIMDGKNQVH
jgi:hypothetical protein